MKKHIMIGSLICTATVLIFLVFWGNLPSDVPIHFDSNGNVNSMLLAKLSFIYFWNIGISFLLLLVPMRYYDSLQKTNVWFYIIDFLQIF